MPPNDVLQAVDIELNSQTTQRVRQYVNEYAILLIMQAKTLAFAGRANQVTPNQLDAAVKVLKLKQRRSWPKDIALLLGSALFGAFIQGFITEVAAGEAYLTAAYAGLGFVGLLVALWGLRR